jgi:hypothetical protein
VPHVSVLRCDMQLHAGAHAIDRCSVVSEQDDVASCFLYYADLAEKLDGRQWEPVDLGEDGFKSAIRREPLGVVVRPWKCRPAARRSGVASARVCRILCALLLSPAPAGWHLAMELPYAHGGKRLGSADHFVSLTLPHTWVVAHMRTYLLSVDYMRAPRTPRAGVEGGAGARSRQRRHPEAQRVCKRHLT